MIELMRELTIEELKSVSGGTNGALGGQDLLKRFPTPKPSPCHR